jgi:hypothetical protein
MNISRCLGCKRRLMSMTDRTGRTKLVCLKCDNVDPMKTDAAKWANSTLANSVVNAASRRISDDGLSTSRGFTGSLEPTSRPTE